MSFKNWKSSIVYGSVLKPVSLAVRLGMTNITSYHWLVGKITQTTRTVEKARCSSPEPLTFLRILSVAMNIFN